MMPTTAEPVTTKTRKRPQVKMAGRQPVAKVKTTCHFSPEAAERLAIHAIKAGMDRSEYLESLVMTYCRRWVISDRGGRSDEPAMMEGSAE